MNSNPIRNIFNLLLVGLLVIPATSFSQCDPLMTPFAENNSQDGIMFDIEALTDVTINQFSANLCDAGPYDMEIYYRAGTHFGFEDNAGAWTLVGSATGVVSAGPDVPTLIPIVVNIAIPTGQRYAFYVTESGNTGDNMCYTNGVSPVPSALATNVAVLTDPNLIVYEGTGKDYAFGDNYYPRMPNFITDYDCCPAPNLVVTDNSCSGMADGAIEATGVGIGPWTYEISDISGVLQTSPATNGPYTFNGLADGQFSVTATDAAGCTAAATAEITPAQPLVINPTITDNQCFGGSEGEASISISGGTGPFDIAWTDAFGNVLQLDVQVSGAILDSLSAGSYLVAALDAAGCSSTTAITVTEPSTPLELYLTPQNLNCFQSADGEVGASQSGTPPYFFEIADVFGNPVASSSNPADYTFTGLDAGIYFVTVTDDDGCTITDDVELFEPDQIEVETALSPVLCFNGNEGIADITAVTGGTAPYGQTTWNDPASQTGNTATDLSPGIVLATVIDANGCELEVEFEFDNPPPLTLTGRYLTDTCGQGRGAAIIDVELGTPPYTYLWKPDSIDTQVHYELGAGSYEVVVTDANGCADSTFVEVSDDLPYPVAEFDYRIEGETLLDNQVQFLNNSNGTSQWTWFFGNGESSNERDPKFQYDRAGDYIVQLLASNGFCVDTAFRYVNIDPMLLVYVPNAFTPGINGINDTFFPQGEGIDKESYDMFIYDRWGKMIWQTGNYSKEWDGTYMDSGREVPVGTYVYLIKFREFADLDRHVYKGIVNVIRD